MAKIDLALLPVAAKLQVTGVMATSKLHFCFPNMIITDRELDSIADPIVCHVRSWLRLLVFYAEATDKFASTGPRDD